MHTTVGLLQSYTACSFLHEVLVVIDGYSHNSTLTSGDSVPLGTQIILVCCVVGLPYGTPLSYTWTCPNGQCEVEGRMIYTEHILVVNTTYTAYNEVYTCQVTAKEGVAIGSFTVNVTGMHALPILSYSVTHAEYGITTGGRIQRKKKLPCNTLCTLINGLRARMRSR